MPSCRKFAVLAVALAGCLASAAAFHALEQREGLMALFQSTAGEGWTKATRWGSTDTECEWFGVVCDQHGYVKQLHLNNNNLHGTLPAKFFSEMPQLRSLFLQTNRIFYTLPPEIGQLSNAAIIWMHENHISGSVPEELGMLSHLQQLYLSDNKFDSTLPAELGNLGNLRDLQVGDNLLEGSLPPELGSIPKLTVLRAQENHLSGSIPDAYGKLTALSELRLDSNQLTGPLPKFDAAPLEELQVQYNRLSANAADEAAACAGKRGRDVCVVLPQHPVPAL